MRVSSVIRTAPESDFLKPLPLNLLEIDQGKSQPVRQKRPEFLHQIEGEAGPAGTVPVEKSHRRVEPHRLQRRADVMDQKRVDEGEQGVDVVQGRPAVPFLEGEVLLLGDDQMVEDAEIDVGGVSLAAAEGVERLVLVEQIEIIAQALHGEGDLICGHLVRMVPERPLEDRPAVGDLSGQDRPGDVGGGLRIVGAAVLLPAQQDISGDRPLHPRQEAAVLRQEADADAVLGAEAHQKGAARDVPEADDAADRVDGEPEADLLLHLDDDRLPLLGEVGALGRDEQRIEMFLHGSQVPENASYMFFPSSASGSSSSCIWPFVPSFPLINTGYSDKIPT